MSTRTTGAGIPAGWYPDPSGAADHRWWDGNGWTAESRTHEVVPALEPAVAPPLRSRREVHARLSAEPLAPPAEATPASDLAFARTSGERGPTRVVLPPYTPVPVRPTSNPRANRALATALIAAASTVIFVLLHIGLQFRGITGAIGLVFAIQAVLAARRSGMGWVRSLGALAISTIVLIIGIVSLVGSVAAVQESFATRVADDIRTADRAASVQCPAGVAPDLGTTFSCAERMADGSTGTAVVTMTSATGFTWTRQASNALG